MESANVQSDEQRCPKEETSGSSWLWKVILLRRVCRWCHTFTTVASGSADKHSPVLCRCSARLTALIMDAAAHVAVVNKHSEASATCTRGDEKLLNFSAARLPHESSRIKRCCVASPWQQGWPHTGHMTDVSEAGVNRVTHSKTKICSQTLKCWCLWGFYCFNRRYGALCWYAL